MSENAPLHGRPPNQTHLRAFASLGTTPPPEPGQRLTTDVPRSLRSRVKNQCVQQGVTIAGVARELREKRFPERP